MEAADILDKVYGAIHGIGGILKGEICDFADEDYDNLEVVADAKFGTLVCALEAYG